MGRTLNVSETSAMLELQLMFKAFDTDKSGTIDKSELQEMMRQLLGSGEDLDELDDMVSAPQYCTPMLSSCLLLHLSDHFLPSVRNAACCLQKPSTPDVSVQIHQYASL